MKEMAQDLRQHNYNYYVLSAPTLPDSEFDKRMRELAELEKQYPQYILADSQTQLVGSDLNSEFETVPHKRRMLSLSNAY